jgi:hypothetical protein
MFRTLRIALMVLAVAALTSQANAGDKDFKDLFNGKDLTGWKTNVFGKDQGKTFTVEEDYIKVSGNPNGYFYTDKTYKNYVVKFDWRYKRPANLEDESKFPGNSGLLVHIQGHGKGWPNCLEVQGENRTHGSFIPIGKNVGLTNAKFDKKTLDKVRNKVGEWNTTEVTINNGDVLVKVNGTQVGSAKFTLTEGPFGFQSEGAELHFKNIKIKTLPDGAPKGDKGAGTVQGKVIVGSKPLASGGIVLTSPDGKKIEGTIKDGAYKLSDVPPGQFGITIAPPGDDGFKPLFNGKDLKGWKTFLRDTDKGDPKTVFVVKDGEIHVSGDPWGYIHTEKPYKNYVIRYSWMYPKDQPEKTTMNSGLLLHIQAPHKVWPKCIEPQGRYKDHGKIFFPGWAKDDKGAKESTFDEAAQKKALKESHEWNTTEATVKADGSISVKINGTPVSTAKTELTSGLIGFQSEGARIHFKDIKIKMLD